MRKAKRSLSATGKSQRLPRSLLMIMGMVIWLVAPIIGFVYLTQYGTQTPIEKAVTVDVLPERSGSEVSRPISIFMHWNDATPVVAPAWAGIVQRTLVSPGSTIHNGDVVAQIGGIDRIAFASSVPFSRVLTQGDVGADVSELSNLLVSRGLLDAVRDHYDYQVSSAVTEFARSIGVNVDNWTVDFDPGWLVFLPSAEVRTTSATLVPGAPAPSPGTVIYESAQVVSSAVLAEFDQQPSAAAAVDEASEARSSPSGTQVVATKDEQLRLGSTSLALDEGRSGVSSVDFSALASLVKSGEASVRAALDSPAPPHSWRLPTAAVFANTAGGACIVLRSGRSVSVKVLAEARGIATVKAPLSGSERIVVNPEAAERECPL